MGKYETFEILNDMSECVTLVKLMDTLGNINHSVSIDGVWVYYLEYKESIPLVKLLLGIIYMYSCDDDIDADF